MGALPIIKDLDVFEDGLPGLNLGMEIAMTLSIGALSQQLTLRLIKRRI